MSVPWYPAAVQDPGTQTGYAHGRTSMQSVVAHYTVGVDSRALLRDQGLCQFLVSRDGTVWQFCEADAKAWHAGEPYNSRGPGIEVEWYEPHDGPTIFTPEADAATGALLAWLNAEWGVSLDYKPDAPRVADWVGVIAHRAIIEDADYHSDYWPYLPTGGDMPLSEADFDRINLIVLGHILDLAGGANLDGTLVSTRLLEQKIDALPAPGPGGGGLTEDQVRAVVRSELDKTKLGH